MKKLLYSLVFICFLPLAIRAQYSYSSMFCQMCWVEANPDNGDTSCTVDASARFQKYYDDGTAENYFAWINPGGMVAVKFQAAYGPLHVYGGSVYVGDGSFPEGADFLGRDINVYVLDDDGPSGNPGSILDSITVTVNNFYWVEFDGLDVDIKLGDSYYMAIEQLESPPYCPPVGIDEENPVFYQNFVKPADSSQWESSGYNDFMIRSYVCGVPGSKEQNSGLFQIIFVSGFNPCNGEGPEDGTLKILGSVNNFPYTDVINWNEQPPGYYAYAVRVNCDTSFSNLEFSNIVTHLMDAEVTVNVACPAGNPPDSLYVILDGGDCVQGYYFEAFSDTGTVIFPEVPFGYYDMTITVPGDHSETYDSVYITSDTVMNINLDYDLPPPDNFTVNAAFSIATWDSPPGDDTDPWQYSIFLDDSLIAEVPGNVFSYFIDCLIYGQEYTAGIQAVYNCGESDTAFFNFTSGYLFPPRLLTVTADSNYLEIDFLPPRDCDGNIPPGLVSFNIYRDWELIGNIPYEGQGTEDWIFYDFNNLLPGEYVFCITALYDLAAYGFPGETGESQRVCDTVEVNYGYELPFTEDWSYGSFDHNKWTTTSSDWIINQNEGNTKPSANFHPVTYYSNYSSSLVSYPINASQLTEGNIWLDFQLKLDDISSGGTEKMTVEVWDGDDWNMVYERTNEGSFDWDTIHFDITSFAMGNYFMVRFDANGQDMSNIGDWFIDNIEVYRDCPSGCDLAVDVDTVGYDQYVLNFTFTSYDTVPQSQWIEWDNGENYSAVGFACTGKFCAAARWDANMLGDYDGYKISRIKAYMYDVGYDSLQFRICTGENGSTHVYSSDYKPPEEIGWIEDNVDTALFLDTSLEYWVGYGINIFGSSVFPMGVDAGPAIPGYGDLIKGCGTDTWDNLSDFGLDYNWNLAFYVEDTSGREIEIKQPTRSSRELTGFNLYERINDGDFVLIDFLQDTGGAISYPYPGEPDGNLHCYQLTAIYESDDDYCESAPFTAKENPDEDYVCVTLVGQNEIMTDKEQVIIYPNPATSRINIRSSETIRQIELFSYTGQMILKKQVEDDEFTLNIAGLKAGLYFARITLDKKIVNKKIVIR